MWGVVASGGGATTGSLGTVLWVSTPASRQLLGMQGKYGTRGRRRDRCSRWAIVASRLEPFVNAIDVVCVPASHDTALFFWLVIGEADLHGAVIRSFESRHYKICERLTRHLSRHISWTLPVSTANGISAPLTTCKPALAISSLVATGGLTDPSASASAHKSSCVNSPVNSLGTVKIGWPAG